MPWTWLNKQGRKEALYRWAMTLALRRPAPDRIPLSDYERVRARDYYSAHISDQDGKWHMLVRTIEPDGIAGLQHLGEKKLKDHKIASSDIACHNVLFSAYYAELEVRYTKPLRFILHYYFPLARISLIGKRVRRFLYRRTNLIRGERMRVLRLILDKHFDDPDYRASPDGLMTLLYGPRWGAHPKHLQLFFYYDMLLKSLAESGDMVKDNFSYRVQPQAVRSVSEYEEEDRRHQDMLRLQRRIAWLTVALVAVGATQAYVTYRASAPAEPVPAEVQGSPPAE
jgi:hypothetical protein